MRIGTSWRGSHGRRYWISMSPLAWVLYGWMYLPFYAAAWLLTGMIWAIYQICRLTVLGVIALTRLVRSALARWTAR